MDTKQQSSSTCGEIVFSFLAEHTDCSGGIKPSAVHFLSERWVVLLRSERMANSSNLFHIIHFYGTGAQSTGLAPRRLRKEAALLFSISIFHPVPLLLSPPSCFRSPQSLLDAITDLVLQWRGGRIDSRAEDETQRRETDCKWLLWLMFTGNILIAKWDQPVLHYRPREPLEVCGPWWYGAQMLTVLGSGVPPLHARHRQ